MELIPILSTIILVATISTFILAIGAYILYKLQEERAEQEESKEVQPETAEFVEPYEFDRRELVIDKSKEKPIIVKRHYQPVETFVREEKVYRKSQLKDRTSTKINSSDPKFVKVASDGYVATDENKESGVISWR